MLCNAVTFSYWKIKKNNGKYTGINCWNFDGHPGICYGVNLRIQSEYREIRIRNSSIFGHFSRSDNFCLSEKLETLKLLVFVCDKKMDCKQSCHIWIDLRGFIPIIFSKKSFLAFFRYFKLWGTPLCYLFLLFRTMLLFFITKLTVYKSIP